MKAIFSLLSIIVLFICLSSCKTDPQRTKAEKIVSEWVGKEIIFPSDVRCTFIGRDTVCPEVSAPYKVLVYTDSVGCTSCKLQIYRWKALISEVDSLMSNQVDFLFYFHPRNEKELQSLLELDRFNQSVFIDTKNQLYRRNLFPDNPNYQSFLLDKDNKVILIGNPVSSPKLWDIYKQAIIGVEPATSNEILTAVELEQTEIEIDGLKVDKVSETVFVLKNVGHKPLLISDILASCGCTIPKWEKKPILPGKQTEIKINVKPDSSGYFQKTITVYLNTEKGIVRLIVKGQVES